MLTTQYNNFIRRFPGCLHWVRLPGFTGSLLFAAGIALAERPFLRSFASSVRLYPFFLAIAIVALPVAVLSGRRGSSLCAFFIAGIMVALVHGARWERREAAVLQHDSTMVTFSGDCISMPAPHRDRFVWLLKLRKLHGCSIGPLDGRIFLCESAEMPRGSGTMTAQGFIQPATCGRNRYDFNERALFRANGITGKFRVERIVATTPSTGWARQFRESVIAVLKRYPDPDHRTVIRASFIGEKEYLAPEVKEEFRRSGLYHLLALSGLHAGILLTAVYLLLGFLPVPAMVKHGCALAVIWLYYLYIGPVPSLARATVMATAVIATLLLQRRNYPLQSLGIAALVWLVQSPESLFQAGFQLSFCATFGIISLQPLLMKSFPGHRNRIVDYGIRLLLVPFSVSFAAICTTLPVLLWHFGSVSLYGLIANIAGAGLMTGTMWSFFAALVAAPVPPLCRAAVFCSSQFLGGLMSIARFSRRIPFSSVTLYAPYPEMTAAWFLFLAALITASEPVRRRVLVWGMPLLCCLLPADYLVHRAATGLQITAFDTGKSGVYAAAVRRPDGTTWLYCSGGKERVEKMMRFSIQPWVRHVPGTVIRKVYFRQTADGKVTMDKDSVMEPLNGVLRQTFTADRWRPQSCTIRYNSLMIPPELLVSCGDAVLHCRGNRITADGCKNGAHPEITAEAPAVAVCKQRCFVLDMFR